MKNWKKIFLVVFVLGLITAAVIFYMAFKKPPTAADSKPIKEFVSEELIAEIQKDKKGANATYMLKNIGVSGKIRDISGTSIFLDAGEGASINCSFDSVYFVSNSAAFTKGSTVKIKGIYYANDGFDENANAADAGDGLDLLNEVKEKTVNLRTCAINQ